MNRRLPMRTCIGCREVREKSELIRIVRQPGTDGTAPVLSADESGGMVGRGAYLCRRTECLERAVKRRGFERAFRMAVSDSCINVLREEIGNIINRQEETE